MRPFANLDEIQRLDPERDCQRILHLSVHYSTYALLDDSMIQAFGFPKPLPLTRPLIRGGLELRGAFLRPDGSRQRLLREEYMGEKKLIWFGATVGSILGGLVPNLWHASMFSMWGLLLSTVGGLVGIWAGWKVGREF